MLTYLIILLDKTSTSFCHYNTPQGEQLLMPIDVLRRGIVWAMKENLNVQFVYPDYQLPEEYGELIETIDHTKIKPEAQAKDADVVVLTEWKDRIADCAEGATCIIRTSRQELAENIENVKLLTEKATRVNVVLTDIASFKDEDAESYSQTLDALAGFIVEQYAQGRRPQLNLLTDRLVLNQMNNCGAGDTTLTLAPDGLLYACPAFYYEQCEDGLTQGLPLKAEGAKLPNQQLLRLDHAPICRVCDAFHCRRCVWMNDRLTGDVNTPGHQQCVVSHIERNAARRLQLQMKERGIRLEGWKEIPELDYLDPFVIATRWK